MCFLGRRSGSGRARHRRSPPQTKEGQTFSHLAFFSCSTLPTSSINWIISEPTLQTEQAGSLPVVDESAARLFASLVEEIRDEVWTGARGWQVFAPGRPPGFRGRRRGRLRLNGTTPCPRICGRRRLCERVALQVPCPTGGGRGLGRSGRSDRAPSRLRRRDRCRRPRQ